MAKSHKKSLDCPICGDEVVEDVPNTEEADAALLLEGHMSIFHPDWEKAGAFHYRRKKAFNGTDAPTPSVESGP